MTIITSVKINDGIVMAADSMSSFGNGMTYAHANKIVNLKKGLPIGAMITGQGGIGNESIETLFKDLRKRFSGESRDHVDWEINSTTYTMEFIALKLREFLYEEKTAAVAENVEMLIRICGYSAGETQAEVWQVYIGQDGCTAPVMIQGKESFGLRWNGQTEALDRLILGCSQTFIAASVAAGATEENAKAMLVAVQPALYEGLSVPSMPIQDAIDLSRFLVETTIGFDKFSFSRRKTVGGPIEIAAITKHEGFKWVQRKHFFNESMN